MGMKDKMMGWMMRRMAKHMSKMMPKMMMGMMGGGKEGTPIGMKSQMMIGSQALGTPMMGQMMVHMMPQCLSTMLPALSKVERVDFVLEMISTLLDRGSADMSEEEKNDLVARLMERITA